MSDMKTVQKIQKNKIFKNENLILQCQTEKMAKQMSKCVFSWPFSFSVSSSTDEG